MDEIHYTEKRPTVALVLSGGGAKGASHVGVLRLLEEMDIPIDVICGTSMGGLVGGLYSVGYTSDQLADILRSQDWGVTLTDKVDQSYFSYHNTMHKSRYALTIPFHYEKQNTLEEMTKIKVGAGAADLNTQAGISNFASSLPAGYVYGFNVNNIISSLTVGYQDSIAFSSLPIPFFAVAADMISCKAKNWGNGSLKNAMRSTMSIPGMFDPVRTDGMVLVDGGTRNNFPVDLARSMGADFVIGVEISDLDPTYDEVNNVGNIMMRFIDMLGRDAFNKNAGEVDVFIKPDLVGYNMLSFNPAAIDTMINRGYEAALQQKDKLLYIKGLMKDNGRKLRSHPGTDISETPVQLRSVQFHGLTDSEALAMTAKAGIKAGTYVNSKAIEEAMSKLQATGAFETVTYSLLGTESPYDLHFDCVKGPTHHMALGFRMDTDEWASLLLNIGLNTRKLQGHMLDVEAKVGLNRYLDFHYALNLNKLPTINAEARVFSTRADVFDDLTSYNFNYFGHKESFYISNIHWTKFDLQLGIRNQSYMVRNIMSEGNHGEEFSKNSSIGTVYTKGNYYTLDNRYFPSKGTDMSFSLEFTLPLVPCIALDIQKAFRLGGPVSMVMSAHTRNIFADSVPLQYRNFIGGAVAGRYLEQQMPFCGFNTGYSAKNNLTSAQIELNVSPLKNLYVSALGGYMIQGERIQHEITDFKDAHYGVALQLGYNTIAGPVKALLNWSDLTHSLGYYISLGFDF